MRFYKVFLAMFLLLYVGSVFAALQITGAGSTFIYPALAEWAQAYNKATGIEINYQPIGSGGGIRAIQSKTVVFAASDQPLAKDQLTRYDLVQAPMIIGGIVPVINVAGIETDQLLLSGPVLADIYLGKIKKWDDPAIKRLNPKLHLPSARIITVHRSDGSGTTFNFTHYLADVSVDWSKNVGANTVVAWPGEGLGAKGNAGVASQVENIPNSIGYVEYAFAIQTDMKATRMQNRDGRDVKASSVTFAAAAENAKWDANDGFFLVLTNQRGVMSWPIVATTFILIPQHTTSVAQRDAAVAFLTWSYKHGQSMAQDLDYVAVPSAVYKKVLANWQVVLK